MCACYVAVYPQLDDFLTLRGLRHHILRWGKPGTGQPMVIAVHGWMDVGASFQFMADCLLAQGFAGEIVALDWRGFGLSAASGSDAYWFPDYLGDLDALIDQLSPDAPVDLLGHSMGGNIAMSYAGVRPQRVRRLINLEGFGLPDNPPEAAPQRLAQWLDELKEPAQLKPYASLADVAARLQKNNPRLPDDKAAWLAPHWASKTAEGYALRADPAHKRVNPMLYRAAEVEACWRAISAPTLWVEGAETQVLRWWGGRYSRSDFDARLSLVPKLQRQVLADAGHMLHHDQPEALAALVTAFL